MPSQHDITYNFAYSDAFTHSAIKSAEYKNWAHRLKQRKKDMEASESKWVNFMKI